MTRVSRAWAWLLGLSAASTALAALEAAGAAPGPAFAAGLLALAGLKAHLILRDYLGLHAARGWLRGLDLALGALLLAFLGLSLAAPG
jgi:hypothetical protein